RLPGPAGPVGPRRRWRAAGRSGAVGGRAPLLPALQDGATLERVRLRGRRERRLRAEAPRPGGLRLDLPPRWRPAARPLRGRGPVFRPAARRRLRRDLPQRQPAARRRPDRLRARDTRMSGVAAPFDADAAHDDAWYDTDGGRVSSPTGSLPSRRFSPAYGGRGSRWAAAAGVSRRRSALGTVPTRLRPQSSSP